MDIRTRKPVFAKILPNRNEFNRLCDAILELIPNPSKKTRDIINEMKWNAYDSPGFRAKYYPQLEEYFHELNERIKT